MVGYGLLLYYYGKSHRILICNKSFLENNAGKFEVSRGSEKKYGKEQ